MHPSARQTNTSDSLSFDPTNPGFMKTTSGVEIPGDDHCSFVSGTRHPTIVGLKPITMERSRGSLVLPATIPLVNENPRDPLSRTAIYGLDLVWQSEQRSMHTMVLGPTGAGKNTKFIDAMKFSAIEDPEQTAASFSLKASDYGPMKTLCTSSGKEMVVFNLDDSWRSRGWNPLHNVDLDEAFDVIRRFAVSTKNPMSSDSTFWIQWIQTALSGAWKSGYRSFPAMYKLFSLPLDDLIKTLKGHNNPSSTQLATFLEGRSQNSDTVLASIVGAMTSFVADNVMRVMSQDELCLRKLFRKPVYLHCEISEIRLETMLVLYQMFAHAVTDALIDVAEMNPIPESVIPATLFYDDLPALGCMLSPTRLMTMRSRKIGTVSGVQSLSSLDLVYGAASRSLIDNIHTKVILPGGVASDAEFFSQSTGQQMVALPCYENQNPTFINRPLLSGADIRTPNYSHPIFGMPATFLVGATSFQAYLQSSYEHPKMAANIRASKGISGREKLRSTQLELPSPIAPTCVEPAPSPGLPPGITNTKGWTDKQVCERLEDVKKTLDFDKTEGSAKKWWMAFESENNTRTALVLRLAEELAVRKANITDFFMAYVYSNTDNIQANLSYLDYTRLKKAEEDKKRKASQVPTTKESQSETPAEIAPIVSVSANEGFQVILESFGNFKLNVVKAVKDLTKLPLIESKRLVESSPTVVGWCTSHELAERAANEIIKAGGIAHVAS